MKSLVCPYHKWGYNLEGKLLNALGIENIEDVVEYDLNMTSVKVEEEAGLVFINFSEKNNIPSLKEYLDNYLPIVADPHNIKNMRRVHEKNYKLKSNWKLYVEVDMETLHTPYIHKNSIGVQPVEQSPAKGEWIGVFSRRATCKKIPKSAHQLPVKYQTNNTSDKNNTLPYIKAPNCYFHELRACFDRL